MSAAIPRVYDVEAVATSLACDEHTVYRLLKAGKLVGFKVGSAWRVTEPELLAFMQRRAVAASVPAPPFLPPADPLAFEQLIPTKRRFS